MGKVKRKPFLITRELEGSRIIIDTRDNKKVFSLNETAFFLWQQCTEAVSIEQIKSKFLETYDGAEADMIQDIESTVSELLNLNLLENIDG